jgi:hypothetical protein
MNLAIIGPMDSYAILPYRISVMLSYLPPWVYLILCNVLIPNAHSIVVSASYSLSACNMKDGLIMLNQNQQSNIGFF